MSEKRIIPLPRTRWFTAPEAADLPEVVDHLVSTVRAGMTSMREDATTITTAAEEAVRASQQAATEAADSVRTARDTVQQLESRLSEATQSAATATSAAERAAASADSIGDAERRILALAAAESDARVHAAISSPGLSRRHLDDTYTLTPVRVTALISDPQVREALRSAVPPGYTDSDVGAYLRGTGTPVIESIVTGSVVARAIEDGTSLTRIRSHILGGGAPDFESALSSSSSQAIIREAAGQGTISITASTLAGIPEVRRDGRHLPRRDSPSLIPSLQHDAPPAATTILIIRPDELESAAGIGSWDALPTDRRWIIAPIAPRVTGTVSAHVRSIRGRALAAGHEVSLELCGAGVVAALDGEQSDLSPASGQLSAGLSRIIRGGVEYTDTPLDFTNKATPREGFHIHRAGNIVKISGILTLPFGTAASTLATLPTAYRPAGTRGMSVPVLNSSPVSISAEPNGNFHLHGAVANGGWLLLNHEWNILA